VSVLAFHLIAAAAAVTAAPTLERPEREDTIYVLHGDLKQLETFETALGEWEGGELIKKDPDAGAYSFWAYSERTAPQARQFIMPAAMSGLKLEVLEYDQATAYPQERTSLDEIAISCGLKEDPFFVSPTGVVQFRPGPQAAYEPVACALRRAMDTDLFKSRFVFVGNEKVSEDKSK